MHSRFVKPLLLASIGVFLAVPASAQIRADVGGLHIRIANDAPPRARYERRPNRPDRQSVWIKGYWDRREDRWDWTPGRWDHPRDRNTRWVSPRYQRENRVYVYQPGHWSSDQLVEGDDYRDWRRDHPRRR
jgi:YXWGXW repeat-containing protein